MRRIRILTCDDILPAPRAAEDVDDDYSDIIITPQQSRDGVEWNDQQNKKERD